PAPRAQPADCSLLCTLHKTASWIGGAARTACRGADFRLRRDQSDVPRRNRRRRRRTRTRRPTSEKGALRPMTITTNSSSAPSVMEVESWLDADRVEFVSLQFTDIMGIVKNVTIPKRQVGEALTNGVWFDGSSIAGFARIAESDMFLMPDRDTYALIPWKKNGHTTARLICDVYMPNGEPFSGDPRAVLKRQLDRLAKLGYGYNTGPELEFFLLEV